MLILKSRLSVVSPRLNGKLCLVAWCLLLALLTFPVFGADAADLEILVETDQTAYALGEPVEIMVSRCNPTAELISYTLSCPCCNQELRIFDRNGAVVALEAAACAQVVIDETLEPGECFSRMTTWLQLDEYFGAQDEGMQVPAGTYEARYRWFPPGVEQVFSSEPFDLVEDGCLDGTLCLGQNQRFRVTVEWTVNGTSGKGVARPDATRDTGSFWFFNEENVELVVKILDGRLINDHFWVYFGSLTDVEFEMVVTDTVIGNQVTYHNAAGNQASRGDTTALPATP